MPSGEGLSDTSHYTSQCFDYLPKEDRKGVAQM